MPPFFPVTLALQAVACTLYVVGVAQPTLRRVSAVARASLLLAVAFQAVDIAWLCLRGLHPGSSIREAVYFLSWLFCLAYPLLSRRRPAPLLGALLLPLAMVLEIIVRLLPAGKAASNGDESLCLASLHVLSATVGTALFGLAAVTGVAYLLSERHLKHHLADAADPRLSLQTLDGWNHQCFAFGLLSFTLTMVSGTYWLTRRATWGQSFGQQVLWLLQKPQYVLSLLTWLMFAGLLFGRHVLGLRGRRAAMWTLSGFAVSVSILAVYLLRDFWWSSK